MSFELPKLEYDYNSLSPVISEETMRLHYGKHHQTYVDNLNKAVSLCEPAKDMSLIELASVNEQLNCSNYQAIINNAGGHYNHKLFWEIIGPTNKNSGEPGGELAKMIVNKYGGFQQFVDQFSQYFRKIRKWMDFFATKWRHCVYCESKHTNGGGNARAIIRPRCLGACLLFRL